MLNIYELKLKQLSIKLQWKQDFLVFLLFKKVIGEGALV